MDLTGLQEEESRLLGAVLAAVFVGLAFAGFLACLVYCICRQDRVRPDKPAVPVAAAAATAPPSLTARLATSIKERLRPARSRKQSDVSLPSLYNTRF